jgi:hypothetical protein
MTQTIVYIDVDGVINSFHKSKTIGWEGEWQLAKVIGYKIHWYTDLVEELNKLAAMENVTVKWLTTWQDKAVTDLCPALGIEGTAWDVLYAADQEDLFDLSNGWWKLRAIMKDVAIHEPDKIVWIDDDFKYDREAIGWAEHISDKILPISPFTDWGMTKEDFDDIIGFINA